MSLFQPPVQLLKSSINNAIPNLTSISSSLNIGSIDQLTKGLNNVDLTPISSGLNTITDLGKQFNPQKIADAAIGQIVSDVPFGPNLLGGTKIGNSPESNDLRVYLRAQPGAREKVYGPNVPDNILSILYETDGILFPYTPSISYNQTVSYQSEDLTHTNMDYKTYTRTPPPTLSISADFTAINQRESKYMLAVIHFFKTIAKMYFGEKAGSVAGLPPPVLIFKGYGNFRYNDVKVLVTNISYTEDSKTNMVALSNAGGVAKVPVHLNLNLTLEVTETPQRMRKEFDLDAFRTGKLLKDSSGWL